MQQWSVFSWPFGSTGCHLVWLPSSTGAQGSPLFSPHWQGSTIRLLISPRVKKRKGHKGTMYPIKTGNALHTTASEWGIKGYFTLKCSTGQNILGLSQMKRLKNDHEREINKSVRVRLLFWLLCPDHSSILPCPHVRRYKNTYFMQTATCCFHLSSLQSRGTALNLVCDGESAQELSNRGSKTSCLKLVNTKRRHVTTWE